MNSTEKTTPQIPLLKRYRRQQNTPRPAAPAQPTAESVVMRFLTQGGAVVEVNNEFTWTCRGCEWDGKTSSVVYARRAANDHAADCRSMPKPTA